MERLFAIGDIHGRLDLLEKLLDTLFKDHALDLSQDKIVFTGDYCDRGPATYGVINKIKELTLLHPHNIIPLAGNHEWINIMRFVRGTWDDLEMFERNGGIQTLESYQLAGFSAMTHDHLEWLSKLPFKHEEPGFFFSHAPSPREAYRSLMNRGLEVTSDELLWSYHPDEKGLARDHGNGIIGVSGHIHQLSKGIMAPRFYDHHYYIDAGAGCSPKAPLCAVEVNTKETIFAWPDPVVK